MGDQGQLDLARVSDGPVRIFVPPAGRAENGSGLSLAAAAFSTIWSLFSTCYELQEGCRPSANNRCNQAKIMQFRAPWEASRMLGNYFVRLNSYAGQAAVATSSEGKFAANSLILSRALACSGCLDRGALALRVPARRSRVLRFRAPRVIAPCNRLWDTKFGQMTMIGGDPPPAWGEPAAKSWCIA